MSGCGVQLLARGRDADIFNAGQGRVLRRYRDPSKDATQEARVMQFARHHGVPVPDVFDAGGPDLVLERIAGPTMGGAIGRRPWTLAAHARMLAELHDLVHRVDGPTWLDQPLGWGDRLIHLDLHPENVLMGHSGPMIIDWANAAVGPGEADVADAWLIISAASAPGGVLKRKLAGVAQRRLAHLFLRAAGVDLTPVLAAAADRRLVDKNLDPSERARISRTVKSFGEG